MPNKIDILDLDLHYGKFQALKAAKMAGCSNEKLEEAVTKAVAFLRRAIQQKCETEKSDSVQGSFVHWFFSGVVRGGLKSSVMNEEAGRPSALMRLTSGSGTSLVNR